MDTRNALLSSSVIVLASELLLLSSSVIVADSRAALLSSSAMVWVRRARVELGDRSRQ